MRYLELSGEVGEIHTSAFHSLTGSVRLMIIPDGMIHFLNANITSVHQEAFRNISGFLCIKFEASIIMVLSSRAMVDLSDNAIIQFDSVTLESIQPQALSNITVHTLSFVNSEIGVMASESIDSVNASQLVFDNTRMKSKRLASGGPFRDVIVSRHLVLANYRQDQINFTIDFYNGITHLAAVSLRSVDLDILSADLMEGFPSEHVVFSHSQIGEILPRTFGDLISVDFSNSTIGSIRSHVFEDLPSMQSITFTGCNISQIETEAFSGLHDMAIIGMNDCELSNVVHNTFHNLTDILQLKLSDKSPYKHIDTIHSGAFSNLTNVHLNLDSVIIDNMLPESISITGNSSITLYYVKIDKLYEHAFKDSEVLEFDMSYSLLRCMDSPYLGLREVNFTIMYCNKNAMPVNTGIRPDTDDISPDSVCLSEHTGRPYLSCGGNVPGLVS